MHAHNLVAPLFTAFLIVAGISGLIAVISPGCFKRLATWSSRWVDTDRYIAVADRPIDIDGPVLQHSRWLGALVLASVAVLASLWIAR